jgi:hypothetical protein
MLWKSTLQVYMYVQRTYAYVHYLNIRRIKRRQLIPHPQYSGFGYVLTYKCEILKLILLEYMLTGKNSDDDTPDMEFLDIYLTILLHDIHSLSICGFLKKIRLYLLWF